MAKLIILEGTRATGKSTVSHRLRQNIEGSTLINFTGFKEDGDYGLSKVTTYYDKWISFFEGLDSSYTIICDRLFFSEFVYSNLYKTYNFSAAYKELLKKLIAQNHKILLYFLSVDDSDIPLRVSREKVVLFDKVEDSVQNIINQRTKYEDLKQKLKNTLNFTEINTSVLDQEEVYEIIFNDCIK